MVLPPLLMFAGGGSTGVLLCLLMGMLVRVMRRRSSAAVAKCVAQMPWWQARWIRSLVRKSALVVAPVLVFGLYASFACAQTTLQHVDPLVFVALQLACLLPVAVVLLCWTMRSSTRASVRLGLLGGVPLGIGFTCVAVSLHAVGIIPTAMLTALDGVMASLIAWLVFHQRLSIYTCLAVACAVLGAVLLWWIAPSRWQMDLVALGCGVLFTLYSFHVERNAAARGSWKGHMLPFFGGLFAAMAAVAVILALCFGQWTTLQTMTPSDWGILLYCSLGTTLVPLILLTILLRSISATTLAFLAVLEPLISIGFAYVFSSLALGVIGWCGVGCILLSMLLQANGSRSPTVRAAPEGAKPLDQDGLAPE